MSGSDCHLLNRGLHNRHNIVLGDVVEGGLLNSRAFSNVLRQVFYLTSSLEQNWFWFLCMKRCQLTGETFFHHLCRVIRQRAVGGYVQRFVPLKLMPAHTSGTEPMDWATRLRAQE